ncbi:MAG: tryptophan-rich sensory protein [Anaerolineae bacterium]|nr:tryptophan-rich sensory protein [Anaerolineae bacterium]
MLRFLPFINLIAFGMTVTVNALANILPINGQQTGEISNRFPVLFVPANYVFAIWGLIYLALAAFVVYQALPGQAANPRLARIGWLFALSNVANTAWIFLWHYELFALTVLVMVGLLISLIAIYLRLGIGRTQFIPTERWLLAAPFSLYLGWITVATIANVTTYLEFANWGGWGISPVAWTVMLLIVGVGIAAAISFRHRDVVYLGVLAWAFAGIAVKQSTFPMVAGGAAAAALLVTLLILTAWVQPTPLRPLFARP